MEAKVWDALVVGGGISGLEASLQLGALGYETLLIEKNQMLGGHVIGYNCKAIDGRCRHCNACLITDRISDVVSNKKIVTMLSTLIAECEKKDALFHITLSKDGDKVYIKTKSILLCTGFKMFDPSIKKNLSYGSSLNVITGLDAERILRTNGKLVRPSDGNSPSRIAFIQCVGSRNDFHVYCSRVCCGYALRLASLISSIQPSMDITIFYMDIQTFSRDFDQIWPKLKERMKFIRQLPGELIPNDNDSISVYVKSSEGVKELTFDMFILSCGMEPPTEALDFLARFNLHKDRDGFLRSAPQEGIFVMGAASGPKSITDCILDVRARLGDVLGYLEGYK